MQASGASKGKIIFFSPNLFPTHSLCMYIVEANQGPPPLKGVSDGDMAPWYVCLGEGRFDRKLVMRRLRVGWLWALVSVLNI